MSSATAEQRTAAGQIFRQQGYFEIPLVPAAADRAKNVMVASVEESWPTAEDSWPAVTQPSADAANTPMPRKDYDAFLTQLNGKISQSKFAGMAFVTRSPDSWKLDDINEFSQRFQLEGRAVMNQIGVPASQQTATINALTDYTSLEFSKGYRQGQAILSYSTQSGKRSLEPGKICMAMSLSPKETPQGFWGELLLSNDQKGIKLSQDFLRSMPTDLFQKFANTHELAHCLYTTNPDPMESRLVANRRNESVGDAFGALYLIQQNEPGTEKFLNAWTSLRTAMSVGFKNRTINNVAYDTSQMIRTIMTDYSNPNGQKKLQGKSLDELMQLADQYARTDIQKDYPHLYQQTVTDPAAGALKTSDRDYKFTKIADYAHAQWRGQGPKMDRPLDAQEAVQLVRLSDAADKVSGNHRNKLAREVDRLRKLQPDIFNAAYKSLGIEPPPLQKTSQDIKKSPMQTAMATGPGMGF